MRKGTVRVLVADDDALIRAALSELIQKRAETELVGAVGDAESAITLAASSLPDVAILDYKMPGGGAYAAREIIRVSPETAVLCLSAYADPGTFSKMRRAGAKQFLIKGTSTIEDIIASVMAVAEREV